MVEQTGQWILVLDDDEVFRRLLTDLLTYNGYSVYEAGTAADASEALEHRQPMLAIVDYLLPDLDGLNWITRVREAGQMFPIVFLTKSWCDMPMFNRLHHILKVSLILRKPIEPNLFMEQIRELLPSASNPKGMLDNVGDRYKPGAVQSSVFNLQQVRHSPSVAEALERAREAFAAELPGRIDRLSQACRTVRSSNADRNIIKGAIVEAHKLRGSAGSFGLHEVSVLSGKVEHMLESLEADHSTMQGILWSELERYVTDLEKAVSEFAMQSAKADGAGSKIGVARRQALLVAERPVLDEISAALKDQPIDLLHAGSAAEALDFHIDRSLHVLAIDFRSCDVRQAFALIERLRHRPGQETLFVIALVDSAAPLPAPQLFYLGVSAILKKPLDAAAISTAFGAASQIHDPQTTRILAVDDDPVITNFAASVLANEGIHVHPLHEPINVLPVLEDFRPHAVLLDVMMPGISGYDVCRLLRERDDCRDLPILFLSAKNDAEGRSCAFASGASDFLAKPILAHELVARVKGVLQSSARGRKAQDRDPSTGLFQRVAFEALLESSIQASQSKKDPLVFCLMEVDQLDELRCQYGIGAAEQVFEAIGSLMRARFRAEDIKAQLANLFVMVCPNKTAAEVEAALTSFKNELAAQRFGTSDGSSFSASVSFGVAQLYRDTFNGVELLGLALNRLRTAQAAS